MVMTRKRKRGSVADCVETGVKSKRPRLASPDTPLSGPKPLQDSSRLNTLLPTGQSAEGAQKVLSNRGASSSSSSSSSRRQTRSSRSQPTRSEKRRAEKKINRDLDANTRRDVTNLASVEHSTLFTDVPHSKSIEGDPSKSVSGQLNRGPSPSVNEATMVKDVEDAHGLICLSLDDEDSEEEVDYEKLRTKNIADNAAFLASIGVMQAKEDLQLTEKNAKAKVEKLTKKFKPRVREVVPRREPSLRLRRISPEGLALPDVPLVAARPERNTRKPSGPLVMRDTVSSDVEEDEDEYSSVGKFLSGLKTLGENSSGSPAQHSLSDQRFLKEVQAMRLHDDHIAKVVSQRIFSVAIHPTEARVLTATGDKWGRLALWDVECNNQQKGIQIFEPHTRPVSHVVFDPYDSNKLLSCSYDGTLRCADLQKGVFDEVFSTPADDDVTCSYFDHLSRDSLAVAQGDGHVSVVDLRSDSTKAEHVYAAHRRSARHVSVHPTKPQYLTTSSVDGQVRLFDIRKMFIRNLSEPLDVLKHHRSVTCAAFSPVTGNSIVTVDFDDKIRVFDSSNLGAIKLRRKFWHNNFTGRWLSTFRAIWHPRRDDVFYCGSLVQPRQVEMYNSSGDLVHCFRGLGSVCSRLAVHPTRNIVVGGNSSGRVHVFM